MKINDKEPSEILEYGAILAAFAMIGGTTYYLYDYAQKHRHHDKKKPAIHAIETKKVSTSHPISSIQFLNKNNQNTK